MPLLLSLYMLQIPAHTLPSHWSISPPLRSANTPTVDWCSRQVSWKNKRKIPRTIKRNMLAECLLFIANWTFSKISTWQAWPMRTPRPCTFLVMSPFLHWMLKRFLHFSPNRLGLPCSQVLWNPHWCLKPALYLIWGSWLLPLGQSCYSNTIVLFHMAHFQQDAALSPDPAWASMY